MSKEGTRVSVKLSGPGALSLSLVLGRTAFIRCDGVILGRCADGARMVLCEPLTGYEVLFIDNERLKGGVLCSILD